MDDGYVKVYETGGSQDSTQNAFGWVDSSGNPPIRFEQTATIDHEGFTRGSESGGFKTVGNMTAILTSYPDGSEPEIGMSVDVTDERGNTFKCVVEEWIPDGSFHGVIAMNKESQ